MRSTLTVAFALLVIVTTSCYEDITPQERAQTERIGNAIIQRVLAFRQQHGRYPTSLAEAHIAAPTAPMGQFRYEPQGADCFALAVGDFANTGINWCGTVASSPQDGWWRSSVAECLSRACRPTRASSGLRAAIC